MDQAKAPERKAPLPKIRRYVGEVVYIYAFDVAYEMTRQPVRELLGQPVAQFVVDASKRSPRQLFFYRPQMVRLPPLERIGPRGPVRVERVIKRTSRRGSTWPTGTGPLIRSCKLWTIYTNCSITIRPIAGC